MFFLQSIDLSGNPHVIYSNNCLKHNIKPSNWKSSYKTGWNNCKHMVRALIFSIKYDYAFLFLIK